jgi:KUP system potassium uptake protein
MSSLNTSKASVAGVLITLGIVFGDIGTSPLYVFQAITGNGENFSPDLILGGLSAVIWTLILIASIKYIYFALNADNRGEGGIFALYALLKEKKIKWIIFPALIGCATLLADGFITPAISISSAVEGINNIYPDFPTIPVVCSIIFILFAVQQFGTSAIGKFFGPIMIIWFALLAILGIVNIQENPEVLKALNPYYAYNLIANVEGGFWVLGAVFLCTTGAEALYSDLGHCGKSNMRISWSFMSVILVINYLGQAALCLQDGFKLQKGQTIFYATVENVSIELLPWAIAIATAATIIASQALITGVFTLMNEAIKLKLWTNLRVKYPSDHQGQIYIPFINWFLMCGCLLVIAVFKKSTAMESAYGLAITINMVMTSLLLCYLLICRYKKFRSFYILIFSIFILIEGTFLLSNLGKIFHGGWFTLILSIGFFIMLFLYNKARVLRKSITEYVPMDKVVEMIKVVRADDSIKFEASNLVYPTRSDSCTKLDSTIYYSLFRKRPRKAGIFWFLHVDIKNEPWGVHYSVNEVIDKQCYYVSLQLGFKEEHRIEHMVHKIHKRMVDKKEIANESIFPSINGKFPRPDFKFIVLNSRVATDNKLTAFQNIYVKVYRFIKSIGLTPAEDFGLDKTNVLVEYVPINVTKRFNQKMTEDFEDYSIPH